jgi:hypothetical protein
MGATTIFKKNAEKTEGAFDTGQAKCDEQNAKAVNRAKRLECAVFRRFPVIRAQQAQSAGIHAPYTHPRPAWQGDRK